MGFHTASLSPLENASSDRSARALSRRQSCRSDKSFFSVPRKASQSNLFLNLSFDICLLGSAAALIVSPAKTPILAL